VLGPADYRSEAQRCAVAAAAAKVLGSDCVRGGAGGRREDMRLTTSKTPGVKGSEQVCGPAKSPFSGCRWEVRC
jgi:hypothetical protein